ncbi:hypothetical protein F5Y16DRAFT_330161 [Xylariaceae sp. FL0255]|nr:hypothetical protein F5Y16DRAFT_330161 [Xylariaceae sp. FL0255]
MEYQHPLPAAHDREQGIRSPLSNKSNLNLNVPSATNLYDHRDSSEAQPSIHSSIVDAACFSEGSGDYVKSPYLTAGPHPTSPSPPQWSVGEPFSIDLNRESPLSRLETPFLYGHGTELAPIAEQRSIATIQTGSLSTSDLSSLMHDAPGAGTTGSQRSKSKSKNKTKDAVASSSLLHDLRNQHSSPSLPNLPSSNQHKGTLTPDKPTPGPCLRSPPWSRPKIHVVDIHEYPRKPIYPAHQPPKTPPGIKKVKRKSKGSNSVSDDSTSSATYTYLSSLNRAGFQIPRFRSPRSGHGNLKNHPFLRIQESNSTPTASSAASEPERGPSTAERRLGHGMRRRENSGLASIHCRQEGSQHQPQNQPQHHPQNSHQPHQSQAQGQRRAWQPQEPSHSGLPPVPISTIAPTILANPSTGATTSSKTCRTCHRPAGEWTWSDAI